MRHRASLRKLEIFWSLLAVFATSRGAFAQPKICGNQAPLGAWSLDSCPVLKDDGKAPDEAAGDGIYTAAVQLMTTPLLEYKILPTGMWDGNELKQVGTCPADGSSKQNDTQNIQVPSPDTRAPTLFFFDSRTLADATYTPAPLNRSGGDSAMLDAPAGSCPTWLGVGDFQNLYGPNGTAVKLSLMAGGTLVGHFTAAKALATGWRWKVVQQTAGVAREYGPSGWAYAPCQATFATVSASVSVGDSVYLLFHAREGRMQTLVSSSPLDGFMPDGTSCQPPPDMAGSSVEMAADLLPPSNSNPDLGSIETTDAAINPPRRPGIHCDCQIGAVASGPPASTHLWLLGFCLAFLVRRRHLRRKRFTLALAE